MEGGMGATVPEPRGERATGIDGLLGALEVE